MSALNIKYPAELYLSSPLPGLSAGLASCLDLSDRADAPRDDAKCIEKLNRVWFRVVKSGAIPVACQVALPGIWFSVDSTCPIWAASSTGRCNTIQCIDSTLLAWENHHVWLYPVNTQPEQRSGWSSPSERFWLLFPMPGGF